MLIFVKRAFFVMPFPNISSNLTISQIKFCDIITLRLLQDVSWRDHMTNEKLYGDQPKIAEKINSTEEIVGVWPDTVIVTQSFQAIRSSYGNRSMVGETLDDQQRQW